MRSVVLGLIGDLCMHCGTIHVSINYSSVQRQRDAASACHASQGGGKMGGGILGPLRRIMAKPVDNFMQAYPPADDGQVSTDLFDGLS